MPPAIPLIIAAAAWVAANAAWIVPLATTVIGVAASFLAPKPKGPNFGDFAQKAQGTTITARQAIGVWRIGYGVCRVGVHPVYMTASENNDKFHMMGVAFAHQINRIGTVIVGDNPVYERDLDGDGIPTRGYFTNSTGVQKYLRVRRFLGADSQAADPDLVSESGGEWTIDHRCRGHAGLYVRFRYQTEKYPSGVPNASLVAEAKPVLDTRDGMTKWTPNNAMCIRDYLVTSEERAGLGAETAEIHTASFEASANVCDEFVDTPTTGDAAAVHTVVDVDIAEDAVNLDGEVLKFQTGDRVEVTSNVSPGVPSGIPSPAYVIVEQEFKASIDTNSFPPGGVIYARMKFASSYANALARTAVAIADAGGGTITITKTGEPRYQLNGSFTVDDPPRRILEDMLTSCGGRLVYSGGQFHLLGLAWIAPTLELDERDFRGPVTWQTRRSRRDRFNAVKGTYVSPLNYWQPSDYPVIKPGAYYSADQGKRAFAEYAQPFTSRAGQAQRLAKIELVRNRFERTLTLRCKLTAFNCRPGQVITVTRARVNWNAKPFEVLQWSPVLVRADENEPPYLGVDLVLTETDESIYDWASTEHQDDPPLIRPTLPNWGVVTAPTSLSARTFSIETEDGDLVYNAVFAWSYPENSAVVAKGWFEVQLRRADGRALQFDGVDDFVQFSNAIDLTNSPQRLTVEVRTIWDGTDESPAIDQGIWTNGQVSIYRRGSDGKICADLRLGAGTFTVEAAAAATAGVEYHIAVTHDGADLKLYLDAVPADTTATPVSPLASTITPQLGRGKGTSAVTNYFPGIADDLRIWRGIAKTADELATAMGEPLSGRETGLVHYWPMDERNATTIFDHALAGNNGSITGALQVDAEIPQDWQPSWQVDGAQFSSGLPGLDVAVEYDLRVRAINSLGGKSPWSHLFGFAVGGSAGATELEDYGLFTEAPDSPGTDYGLFSDPVDATEDHGTFT